MRGGRASALGRTQGNGPVDAGAVIARYMGGSNVAPTNNGASGATGQEDDLSGLPAGAGRRNDERKRQLGQLFGGLLGGIGGGAGGAGGNGATGLAGLTGGGGDKNDFAQESMVADTAGSGATQGMPTADDNGVISMVYRQVRRPPSPPENIKKYV
jgi:hypothetical protein